MTTTTPRQGIERRSRRRLAGSISVVALLGLGFIFPLFWTVRVQAQATCLSGGDVCSQAYLDGLPAPTPMNGSHRVVQLVNCSCQTLLGATLAAHRSGEPGFPVLPREATWVMQPYSPTCSSSSPGSCTNILTIDIPQKWENTYCPPHTTCPSIVGPRFWARTGCRYDIPSNKAQCETGSCADQYDCSSASQADAGFTSLSEWTFYQPSADPTIFIDNPDISLVDGTSLNLDIQAVDIPGVGGKESPCPAGPFKGQNICSPLGDHTDEGWLMYNYPLTVHGADLRANNPATNQSCTDANGNSFLKKRSDIDKTGIFGFVIEDGNGDPVMPRGDYPLACLNNCEMYKFASTPSGSCDPFTEKECYGWNVFCSGDGSNYGKTGCTTDKDCKVTYMGQPLDVHASCYKNTNPYQPTGKCALRAFYRSPNLIGPCQLTQQNSHLPGSPASLVPCTFTYGASNPLITAAPPANYVYSSQPPAAPCTDVIGPEGPVPCVGDDTIHQVFHGGYTWPNDPEVFGGDSPLYRVIFAPGGTSVPITPATNGIPLCSDLPSNYNYAQNFINCAGSMLVEGADFNIANDKGMPWSCALGSQNANTNNGVLCRWHPAPTTPTGCTPPLTDQNVTQSACGLIDGATPPGRTLVSSSLQPNNNDPLFLEITIPQVLNPVNLPTSPSGCASSWSLVPGGSLFINQNQGLIAWYSGTANTSSQCQVTVTLAEPNPAALKVYDVPGYNGTVETTSNASGSYNPASAGQPAVFAQSALVTTAHPNDLMLGSLLQVNQQLTPPTYWQDWLTNTVMYSPPGSINCENNFCPANDGTDYLPGHGSYSSNADAGHRAVGPGKTQQHALERRGFIITPFNWGGVAIYIELKATPLAVACASSTSAQVGVPYASPLLATGGAPDYNYNNTGGLPPGLNLLGLSNPYIYGTPTTAGTYPYTAQVTDSTGANASNNNCSITVKPQ